MALFRSTADLAGQCVQHGVDKRGHGPGRAQAGNLEEERAQDFVALLRMGHFRMELQGVHPALDVGHGRNFDIRGPGRDRESGRHCQNVIAVRHPHRQFTRVRNPLPKRTDGLKGQVTAAVLAIQGRGNLAAKHFGHELHAVADAQNWESPVENGRIDTRSIGAGD
jgi:hypothetical protein